MTTPTPGTLYHLQHASCFSATWAAAPADALASFRVAGVRGEATVTSKAAGFPLSQLRLLLLLLLYTKY